MIGLSVDVESLTLDEAIILRELVAKTFKKGQKAKSMKRQMENEKLLIIYMQINASIFRSKKKAGLI